MQATKIARKNKKPNGLSFQLNNRLGDKVTKFIFPRTTKHKNVVFFELQFQICSLFLCHQWRGISIFDDCIIYL